MKWLIVGALCACSVLVNAACESKDSGGKGSSGAKATSGVSGSTVTSEKQWAAEPKMTVKGSDTLTATVKTTEGDFTIELLPKQGLHAVNNFVFLAREGFYTNVPFHRVMTGFMIQSGDPTGTGSGGPGYTIEDDKVSDSYKEGTVAMANTGAPNSGGSQFFICVGSGCESLPPTYPIFGEIASGMSTVLAIADAPVEASDSGEPSKPESVVRIKSVQIT